MKNLSLAVVMMAPALAWAEPLHTARLTQCSPDPDWGRVSRRVVVHIIGAKATNGSRSNLSSREVNLMRVTGNETGPEKSR